MSEMEGETPLKRARPAGDTELRLLIQSKAAGSVIGKGGQNISRLRSEVCILGSLLPLNGVIPGTSACTISSPNAFHNIPVSFQLPKYIY
ncbi:hypothetical protein SK128_012969 [Halocaridina rubra]|uniref:K Homology domain-containing protein n=1 Tax=Halocaridina rubra TaxID=373956 RepID=A0AAN8XJC8_HALRR